MDELTCEVCGQKAVGYHQATAEYGESPKRRKYVCRSHAFGRSWAMHFLPGLNWGNA